MTLAAAAEEFGLSPGDLPPMHAGLSYRDACEAVLELKKIFRARRRELALIHHPDRGGDGRRMARINMVMDQIEKLAIVRRPPPRVVVRYYSYYSSSTTTSSTTSTWGW